MWQVVNVQRDYKILKIFVARHIKGGLQLVS